MRLKSETHAKIAESLAGFIGDPEDTAAVRALLKERFAQLDTDGASVEDVATMQALANAAELLPGTPAPVTATGAVQRMARRQPTPSPEATPARHGTALVAAAGAYGVAEGVPFGDKWALGEAMAETLNGLDRHGPSRGKVLIASARTSYPEERKLGEDAGTTERLIDAVTSLQALTATGGICQPVNVDYSVPTWGTAERPLRDGLPAFEATRGGIRFVKPPDIAEWEAATGIWTEATDAEPGSSTKPVLSMTCGSEEHVFIDAVSTRIGFGNMQARFAPEQVAANTEIAAAAAARVAEVSLLNKIAEACVKGVTTGSGKVLGATRDLLSAVSQVAAQQRQLHRLPDSVMLTAVLPRWARDLIRADLAREIGHAQDADWNSLAVTDAQIDELLGVSGIHPIWHLDGQPSGVEGGVAQTFALPVKGAIKAFPTALVWYVFPEGQIQYLDAGRLDLGVVRDSTLDATNDYECFFEVFENVAFRGYANGGLQLVSTLCANGASAGTQDTKALCA